MTAKYRDLMVDSSPEISMLEEAFAGRSVVPADPATAFLDFLLEDFGDEWVSKMMYHWRWANDVGARSRVASCRLTEAFSSPMSMQRRRTRCSSLDRSRRGLIGSSDNNAPVIEGVLRANARSASGPPRPPGFFFGDRPGRSDFAVFGQLLPMLWWDPTPTFVGLDRAPRALMWVQWMDDLSWWRVETKQPGGAQPMRSPTRRGALR